MKNTFASKTFAAWTFASGTWAGVGVESDWTDPTCTITTGVTMTANEINAGITMTANTMTTNIGMGCGNQG